MSSCRLRKIVETDGGQTITITRATAEAALAEVSLLRTRVSELEADLTAKLSEPHPAIRIESNNEHSTRLICDAARREGARSMRERAASVWEAEAKEYRRLARANDLLPSLIKEADGARAIAARIRALPLDAKLEEVRRAENG